MDDLTVAHRLADVADVITRAAYQPGRRLPHEIKADGSPVTDHDRRVERALREELHRLRPADGFLGEEVGAHGDHERRWVVDGIDGTISFVLGDPRWSTQIALMNGDIPIVGVSTSPAQRRRWWATAASPARTAMLTPAGLSTTSTTLHVSSGESLDRTVTCIPPRDRLTPDQERLFARVLGHGRYVEPTTHGAKMVAAGQVDACLQLRGELWDYAALTVVVEQAGGTVTCLEGPRRLDHGGALLFSNGHLRP